MDFWMLKTATIVGPGHHSRTLLNLPASFFHSFIFWKRSFTTPCHSSCFQFGSRPLITRMRSNPRYKLGRIFFFHGTHVHCSQWLHLLFFPSGIKIAWRVSCGELGYCLTRCTNPELVAKCEHILCVTSLSCELNERAAKPKFVAQSGPSFFRNRRVDRARWRTWNNIS